MLHSFTATYFYQYVQHKILAFSIQKCSLCKGKIVFASLKRNYAQFIHEKTSSFCDNFALIFFAVYGIIFMLKGYSSVGRTPVSKTGCRGFESFCPCQKNSENIVLGIFLSKPKDWYVINALARCMELRRSRVWHRAKRVSNLTAFGLMPCSPLG